MERPVRRRRGQSRPQRRFLSFGEQVELLDLAHDAILVRGFDGRTITYWNRGAEVTYGWSAAEALGRVVTELLATRYSMPLEQIEHALLTTGRWEGQLEQTGRDGRTIPVDARWALVRDRAGEPIRILEVNRELSGNKLVDEALWRSEIQFRLLADKASDYAICLLDDGGRVTSWNTGAERINGFQADEILGRHFSVFYPLEDAAAGTPDRQLARATAEGHLLDEAWRVRKDGSRFWASVVITPVRGDKGTPKGFVKITRDMTERRQLLGSTLALEPREATRFGAEAERITQLEYVKSLFLRVAAHELRRPLGLIGGYLSLLAEGDLTSLPEQAQQALRVVHANVQEMDESIERVLEAARLDDRSLELRLERVRLPEVLGKAVQRIRPIADLQHRLRVDLPSEPVHVTGDFDRIVTILVNLLDNAVKYSPAGGEIACRLQAEEGWASVHVTDTGIGIASEDFDQLFTRFGRLAAADHPGIRGTGLGLYVSRELARMQGGDITVRSQLGVGSTFTLRLPS